MSNNLGTAKPMFSQSTSNDMDFTMNPDSFAMLINHFTKMYSDPASATIREVFSNAYDATKHYYNSTGIKNSIIIDLPNFINDNHIVIRDYGYGMTLETVLDVVRVYGESTKTGMEDSTGKYGFGFKSPLSLVDSFNVSTINNGRKVSFSVLKIDDNPPKIINLDILEPGEHDEKDGTIISIPTKETSPQANKSIIKTVLTIKNYFTEFNVTINNIENNTLNVHGVEYLEKEIGSLKENFVLLYNMDYKGKKVRVFANRNIEHDYSSTIPLVEQSEGDIQLYSKALLNGYLYDLNDRNFPVYHTRYIIELEPGMVSFPPSRDNIIRDSKLLELINAVKSSSVLHSNKENLSRIIADRINEKDNYHFTLFIVEKILMNSVFSQEEKSEFIRSILDYNGKKNELKETIDLNEEKQLLEFLIDNSDFSSFPYFGYGFSYQDYIIDSNNSTKTIDYVTNKKIIKYNIDQKLSSNNINSQLSLESIMSFYTDKKQYSASRPKNAIIVFDNFSDTSRSLVNKVKKFKLSDSFHYGENYDSNFTFFFPNKEDKGNNKYKDFFKVLSDYCGIKYFNFDSVEKIPTLKPTRINKTNRLYNIALFDKDTVFTSESSNYNDKISFLENILLTEIRDYDLNSDVNYYSRRMNRRKLYTDKVIKHNDLVEYLNNNNSHVVIIPKNHTLSLKNHSLLSYVSNVSFDKRDNDFLKDKKIIVINEPYADLLSDFNVNNIDYSVIGNEDDFTKKSLKSKTISSSFKLTLFELYAKNRSKEDALSDFNKLSLDSVYISTSDINDYSILTNFIIDNPYLFSTEELTIANSLNDFIEAKNTRDFSTRNKNNINNLFFHNIRTIAVNNNTDLYSLYNQHYGIKKHIEASLSLITNDKRIDLFNLIGTISNFNDTNRISKEVLSEFAKESIRIIQETM